MGSAAAVQTDIGALLLPKAGFATVQAQVLAGGGLDGVQQTGRAIDRFLLAPDPDVGTQADNRRRGLSLALSLDGVAVLDDDETVTLNVVLEHADDLAFSINNGVFVPRASIGDPTLVVPDVVVTAPAAGGPHTLDAGILGRYDLTGARQFVRALTTVTLSRGATDTFDGVTSVIFGGAQLNPFTPGPVGSSVFS